MTRKNPATALSSTPFTTMTQYLLLIQSGGSPASDEEWERFIMQAKASGMFSGGSAVGAREIVGDAAVAHSTGHIVGYMRFDTDDKPKLLALLQQHPVVRHGGAVELCELPRS